MGLRSGPLIPPCASTKPRIMQKSISALRIFSDDDGAGRLGMLTQIGQDAQLEICGDGFNERTVKVRWEDTLYFVFRQDIGI